MSVQEAIDFIPELVCIFNSKGQIYCSNSKFKRGVTLETTAHSFDLYLHETLRDDFQLAFNTALFSENHVKTKVEIEFLSQYKSGDWDEKEFTWEVRGNGHSDAVILIGREIMTTEAAKRIHNVEAKLAEKLLAQSSQLLETKRLFTRCVCHEVRTPLSVVLSGIFMLEKLCKNSPDKMVTETLVDIKLSCQAANDIMKALMVFEQLESKTLQLHPVPMDLNSFVEAGVCVFEDHASLWDITITLDVEVNHSIVVNASVDEFGLAVRALIDNAVKFTPQKGCVAVKVSVLPPEQSAVAGTPRWVRVEVTDNGPGLSAEEQVKIFENIDKFTPTTNETEQGRGVAICVVHGIVSLHNGRIGVSSSGPGLGSTYFIDLPVAEIKSHQELPQRSRRIIHQGSFAVPLPKKGSPYSIVRNLVKLGVFHEKAAPDAPRQSMIYQHFPEMLVHPRGDNAQDVTYGAESLQKVRGLMRMGILKNYRRYEEELLAVVKSEASHNASLRVMMTQASSISTHDPDKLRLLLVDDVPSCRKMLNRLLTHENCFCEEARDGLEAVSMVKSAMARGVAYDGVFMDASMPHMTGPDAVQALRIELGYTKKIFGVTGNSHPSDVNEFLDKGADEVKIKPMKIEDVYYCLDG